MADALKLLADLLPLLSPAIERLQAGFASLPPSQGAGIQHAELEGVLDEVARRLQDNYPYHHPLYAGQMLKPPHPTAQLAYTLAMCLNPNNHALDGGRASSSMEKEAVAALARMFGWTTHLGHLCSGGTMANLEALWIARQLHPRKAVVASEQAHYTHQRLCGVLGIEFSSVPADRYGRMDLRQLERLAQQRDIGTVVATIGTTATGAIDPLPGLLRLRDRFGFRIHADAAYGGYFTLVDDLPAAARASLARLTDVDSLVVDPHKHGLQPYGCGCVLFRDPAVGRFYKHDSPYTYFTSHALHLGEISLECSRPGAAAVALWATLELFPLVKSGRFAQQLSRSCAAARALYRRLRADPRFVTAFAPELDIVVWTVRAPSVREASRRAQQIFAQCARRNLHLALAKLPTRFFERAGMQGDADRVLALRSALMKPEHADWLDRIYSILDAATRDVLRARRWSKNRRKPVSPRFTKTKSPAL